MQGQSNLQMVNMLHGEVPVREVKREPGSNDALCHLSARYRKTGC